MSKLDLGAPKSTTRSTKYTKTNNYPTSIVGDTTNTRTNRGEKTSTSWKKSYVIASLVGNKMAVLFTIRNIQLIRYVVSLVIARPLQHALPLTRTHIRTDSGSVSRSPAARGSKKKTDRCHFGDEVVRGQGFRRSVI